MSLHVLFCGSGWFPLVAIIRERLDPADSVSIWNREQPLVEAVRDTQVILPSNARIDAKVIAAADTLRLIQQPAAGVDTIDVAAATAAGVPVCNAPASNQIAVAEAALLLMLALARRLPEARRALAAGHIGGPLGRELRGRILGVVGTGNSGSALADIGRGLGMSVLAINSRSGPDQLDRLLRTADVISLHCPLTERTRGLIDERALSLMKPDALLINCARGPIIDRQALERALAAGHLGGVGLDVMWREPWAGDDPLFASDKVVALPHVAGSTEESFARIADIVADNVKRLKNGRALRHRVP